jgi:hypothetical protein
MMGDSVNFLLELELDGCIEEVVDKFRLSETYRNLA